MLYVKKPEKRCWKVEVKVESGKDDSMILTVLVTQILKARRIVIGGEGE